MQEGQCGPSGVVPGFINSVGGNIDLNTETVAGKNTCHQLGTIILQEQKVHSQPYVKMTLGLSPQVHSLLHAHTF